MSQEIPKKFPNFSKRFGLGAERIVRSLMNRRQVSAKTDAF